MRFREFHYRLAQRFLSDGCLDLCCLEINHQIVAVLYSFLYGNKVYYYNAGFDPQWAKYSLGSVLMAYHVESAFERGYEEYDFLRGQHSYKFAWTSCERCHRNVLILQRSPKALAWYALQRGVRSAPNGKATRSSGNAGSLS